LKINKQNFKSHNNRFDRSVDYERNNQRNVNGRSVDQYLTNDFHRDDITSDSNDFKTKTITSTQESNRNEISDSQCDETNQGNIAKLREDELNIRLKVLKQEQDRLDRQKEDLNDDDLTPLIRLEKEKIKNNKLKENQFEFVRNFHFKLLIYSILIDIYISYF
jgi:hypothetical protein